MSSGLFQLGFGQQWKCSYASEAMAIDSEWKWTNGSGINMEMMNY